MATAVAQRSFAGGELAPACYARTDLAKYATGLRTCRNVIVQRHGGATNRPGTVFIAETKNSAVACRLIPFVLDATDIADTYVLEFGNGYIRFFQDGAAVTVSSVTAWADATDYVVGDLRSQGGVNYYCIADHTSALGTDKPGVDAEWPSVWYALTGSIYEIPTPYATADLAALNFVQSGDIITIVHPSYAPRELARSAHTTWTLSTITFGPSIAKPANVAASGGSAGTRRYWAVTAVKELSLEESLAGLYDSTDKIPSAGSPVALTWDSVAGAISYNVYRSEDGQTYGLINSAGGNPVLNTDSAWGTASATATGTDPDAFEDSATVITNALAAISAAVRAYDGNYTLNLGPLVLTPGSGSTGETLGRVRIYYSRDGETPVLAVDQADWSATAEGVSNVPSYAYTVNVPDNGYTTLTFTIVVGCKMDADAITSATFAVTGVSVTWYGGVSGFSDVGDTPDYSIGPPSHPALFQAVDHYPSAVMYHQQRLMLARTNAEPEKVWGSKTGSFKNFSVSTPLQADDSVAFTLAGRRVNAVKHLLELGALVIFGTEREQLIGGDDADILRPDSINPKKLTANGSGTVAPVEVVDSAVYVQGRGKKVLDLKPIGLDGYQGNDLTVFATHLFERYTIVDMAFQQTPNSVIWVVRSDGVLLGLTYMPDQAVWGWHRHDTLGDVERVCVIPEDDEDALYLIVKRTVDGATVRYLERLSARYVADSVDAIFMDSALTYDGWQTGAKTITLSGGSDWNSLEQLTATASAATFASTNVGDALFLVDADDSLVRLTIESYTSSTVVKVRADRDVPATMQAIAIGNGNGEWALAVDSVSGLDHLEGEDVAILGDAFVVASPNNAAYTTRTVSGGAVTLDRPYAVIHVGLPYISDLETLDLDSAGSATNKDKKLLINRVGLYVESSRGIWAGRPDKVTADDPLAGLQEYKGRTATDVYDDPPELVTDPIEINVDASWNNKGRVLVRQVDPLPLTVLSATPIVQ